MRTKARKQRISAKHGVLGRYETTHETKRGVGALPLGRSDDREQARRVLHSSATSTLMYIRDILNTAFWLLKMPFGVLAFVLVLSSASSYVLNASLSPLCRVPGFSSSAFCSTRGAIGAQMQDAKPKSTDFLKLIELQDSFRSVMEANSGTSEISLKLKQSEMATRDLITLVSMSGLNSRDVLADALLRFVEDAKATGEALHKLSAKVDGAVDRWHAICSIGFFQGLPHPPGSRLLMTTPCEFWSRSPKADRRI